MKKNKLILLLSVLTLIGTVISYFYLPERIPMHWNHRWEVTRYDHKATIFITGSMPLLSYILFNVLPKIDPKRDNYKKHQSAYWATRNAFILLMIVTHWVLIAIGLGSNLEINIFVPVGIGLLFMIIGNYMPQFRHNYFIGIRTPWTLMNEHVWKKTHQLGGYLFMLVGIYFIITAIINFDLFIYISLGFVLLVIIVLTVYSYIQFKNAKKVGTK
ncbi:putative membrane protein [Natranaerovirga pectinivora]|uniref:Putative membrane protein n=1 Tax=Natranaerovirga pectinivora TaxID=682400 RepID=A0A4V2V085_9FIRM|nr:SdpI family protein [Natranaerovirga pectinivora]TCT14643.1 putative membrane protein [Natranaerovirga pectinivora]